MASDEAIPYSNGDRYTEQECLALLERMFPNGLDGEDVLRELAPAGWASSPLLAVVHPSVERRYEEAVRIHRNLRSLLPPERRSERPDPTLEEIRAEHREQPVDPPKECRELMAECLWDIFSDNHEVVAADGRVVDLGSFRGSAGLLADFVNRRLQQPPSAPSHRSDLSDLSGPYDYMDFYMGTIWVGGRADLTPVYEMIFRRLKALGLDWVYHFPRLSLVDMRPLLETLKKPGEEEPEWASYNPSEALAAEQERAEHDARGGAAPRGARRSLS